MNNNTSKNFNANKSKKFTKKPKKKMQTRRNRNSKPNINTARARKVARQKSAPIIRGKTVLNPHTGTVDVYTAKDLETIRRATKGQLPENYVYLTEPNNVTWNNDVTAGGVAVNWEPIVECILAGCVAKHPGLFIPFGPAALKLYLFWAWISRLRKQSDQALYSTAGNNAQFSDVNWPQFNEREWNVPTFWAKFIEYQMPYVDPDTGTKYQYTVDWDILTGGSPPLINGPSILPVALAAGNFFNRSILMNSFLTLTAETKVGSATTLEQLYAIDPNGVAAGITNQKVFASVTKISDYFRMATACTTMDKVPTTAPDGSMYSYVFSSASQFPGIVSNLKYVNAEASYMLHVPQSPVTGFQTRETFRYIKPIPSIVIDDSPTNLPVSLPPAQMVYLMNAANILNLAHFSPGGFKKCLGGVKKVYPQLQSFSPNYYTLNLSMWHSLVAYHVQQLLNNTSGQNTMTQLTATQIYAITTCWESALLSRVFQFAYPSIAFYTNSDMCSTTACASQFTSISLPPVLADYIDGVAPIVVSGQLYTPLLDYRPPSTNFIGASFFGLAAGYDPNTARWLTTADVPVTTAAPIALPNFALFVPSTAAIAQNVPPTSLDQTQPYALGFFNTVSTPFILNFTQISRFNMLGGTALIANVSDAVPGANSVYAAATPWKYASSFVTVYASAMQNSATSLLVLQSVQLGTFAQMSPIQINNVSLTPFTNLLNLSGATITLMIDVYPKELGAQQALDPETVGHISSYGYRVTGSVSNMPFIVSLAQTTNSSQTLALYTMRQSGNNEFLNKLATRTADLDPIYAVRSALSSIFESIVPNKGTPMSVGNAAALVIKNSKGLVTGPYHDPSSGKLGVYGSPSTTEEAVGLTGGVAHMGLNLIDSFLNFFK